MRNTIGLCALVIVIGVRAVDLDAQSAAGDQRQDFIAGSCNMSPIVAKIEATLPFYRDVLGLEFPPAPSSGVWPFDRDPVLMQIHGLPDARLRFVSARVPGARCGIELVDFADVDRRPMAPQLQDPGAVTMVLLVRDVETVLARARQAGARIISSGGKAVQIGTDAGPALSFILATPDGQFIEIRQLQTTPATTAPPESNILGARLRLVVEDTEAALRLYRDRLGFSVERAEIAAAPLARLLGVDSSPATMTLVQVPGSPLRIELLEFPGARRPAVRPRIQDPGAMRLQLSARDIDGAVRALIAGGATVVSTDGRIYTYTTAPARPGVPFRLVIAREVTGLYLVLMQGPPAPARTAAP